MAWCIALGLTVLISLHIIVACFKHSAMAMFVAAIVNACAIALVFQALPI